MHELLVNNKTIIKHLYSVSENNGELKTPNWSIKPLTSIISVKKSIPSNKFAGTIVGYEQVEVVKSSCGPAIFYPETCTALSFYCGPAPPYVYAVGPMTQPVSFGDASEGTYFVVVFSPAQIYSIISTPLYILTNSWSSTAVLSSFDWRPAFSTICQATSFADRIYWWEIYYAEILKRVQSSVPLWLLQAVNFISRHPDETYDRRISKYTGYSTKHIRNQFNHFVGLTPKTFSRILRHKRAIYNLSVNRTLSMATLSQDLGYFDQSHFIHEFKSLSGKTPSEFIKEYSLS
jgi:AraC-like DNA-binding protein